MNVSFDQKIFLIAILLSVFFHFFLLSNIKFDAIKNNFLDSQTVIQMFILSSNQESPVSKSTEESFLEQSEKEAEASNNSPKAQEELVEVIPARIEGDDGLKSMETIEEQLPKEPIDTPREVAKNEESLSNDNQDQNEKERKFELDTAKLFAEISSLDLATKKTTASLRVKRISARSKDYEYRSYFEAWQQKVERIGALNYPKEADQGNFGALRLTVSIRQDGSVEKVVIEKSSGSKALDEAAKNIVMLAAPFAEFSQKMRNEVDIINISRSWKFTNSSKLIKN